MNAEFLKMKIKNAVKEALAVNEEYPGLPKGWSLKKDGKGKYSLTDPTGAVTYHRAMADEIIAWAKKQQKRLDEYERTKHDKPVSEWQRMADEKRLK